MVRVDYLGVVRRVGRRGGLYRWGVRGLRVGVQGVGVVVWILHVGSCTSFVC